MLGKEGLLQLCAGKLFKVQWQKLKYWECLPLRPGLVSMPPCCKMSFKESWIK